MRRPDILACTWQTAQLADCVTAIITKCGIAAKMSGLAADEIGKAPKDPDAFIQELANRTGCEADVVEMNCGDLDCELAHAYPAVLRVGEHAYLACVGSQRSTLDVLTPNMKTVRLQRREIARLIRAPYEEDRRSHIETLLHEAGVRAERRSAACEALLSEQLGNKRFNQCWVFRQAPGAGSLGWLRQANAIRDAASLVTAHGLQYVLWLASWAMLGNLSLQGRMDSGWLLGWALLCATLLPFRVLETWLQGVLVIRVGGLLKRRLLAGALRLNPEEVRHGGIGTFLGQALEAEAIETLALGGGVAGLLAIVELGVAAFILGGLAFLMLFWFAVTAFVGFKFFACFQKWTGRRMEITNNLIESLVGHRTRLAQQRREYWYDSEDLGLHNYFGTSQRLDRATTVLIGAIPRGWLITALAFLAPSLVTGKTSASQTAMMLGGILLAFTAFERLAGSASEIASAWVAWKRISHLFHAASRNSELGQVLEHRPARHEPGTKLIEAQRLTFTYPKQAHPTLKSCSLVVRRRERILLEGPSGGGKSTLASLLSGTRKPDSGLLLANGLDMPTLGAALWRKSVTAVPQFHENYILTETLAFNLLFGRRWPPTVADMEEAESVCRSLGLGNLIDRMPSGLLQMVGEGGWQLSHGERSRIYIARALLQKPELMILDESFGALDPENLQLALEFTLKEADTLMVIAHP
ncbi:MAG: ABC transporter ATP-binding protein [Acidobacteriaceae bacterium]|nr:ABC transporter ATP-binding protein [Acidobacteriaceae bacterium]